MEQSHSFEPMVLNFRTINFPALVSFHEVVHLGSVTAAAESLGVAKSAVSRHVRQLEDQFAVKLFERGGRNLQLTKTGGRLHERVSSILMETELLTEIAHEERSIVSGRIRIAATPEFGALLADTVFPEIARRYPLLRILLQPSYDFEDIQDPAIDLAFRIGSTRDDRLVVHKLGAFRRILVASPTFLKETPIEAVADLARVRCLLFRVDSAPTVWSFVDRTDESPKGEVTVDGPIAVRSFSTIMQLAINGHGVAYLPEFLVKPALKAGILIQCLPMIGSAPMPVFLTYRPSARTITRLRSFIDLARELTPKLLLDRPLKE